MTVYRKVITCRYLKSLDDMNRYLKFQNIRKKFCTLLVLVKKMKSRMIGKGDIQNLRKREEYYIQLLYRLCGKRYIEDMLNKTEAEKERIESLGGEL